MLTVDYDRLDLRPGMIVLDLGAGFGRHAFETARRGASVIAVDLSQQELIATKDTFGAMYRRRRASDQPRTPVSPKPTD